MKDQITIPSNHAKYLAAAYESRVKEIDKLIAELRDEKEFINSMVKSGSGIFSDPSKSRKAPASVASSATSREPQKRKRAPNKSKEEKEQTKSGSGASSNASSNASLSTSKSSRGNRTNQNTQAGDTKKRGRVGNTSANGSEVAPEKSSQKARAVKRSKSENGEDGAYQPSSSVYERVRFILAEKGSAMSTRDIASEIMSRENTPASEEKNLVKTLSAILSQKASKGKLEKEVKDGVTLFKSGK